MMSEFIFLSSRLSFIFVSSSAVNENALRSNEFFFKSFVHFPHKSSVLKQNQFSNKISF